MMPGNSSKLEASATFVLDRRFNGVAKSQNTSASSKSVSRLKYRDFLPEINSKSPETFQHLLNKANDWLRRNPYHAVKCCETVTWMSHDRKYLEDSELMTMSKKTSPGSMTYFVRGLRVWLIPRLVTGRPEVICHRDFLPTGNQSGDNRIQQLISTANRKFGPMSKKCKILTTETVAVPLLPAARRNSKVAATEQTDWEEPVNDDIHYHFLIRLFYTKADLSSKPLATGGVEIGIQDVVPQVKPNGDYEGFEELTERANRWLKDQSNIIITNMQSITVQRNAAGPHSETGSDCFYIMPGINNEHPTDFFRILRIAFFKPIGDLLADPPPQVIYPFTFQTFAPKTLRWKDKDLADVTGAARSSSSTEPGLCRMEKMKETFSRALAYLRTTGVEIISAETVTNPLQFYSEEDEEEDEGQASSMLSSDEVSFLLTIRLYVTDQATVYRSDVKRSSINSLPMGRDSPAAPGGAGGIGESDPMHPGPIFLRNVVTRRYKYRWLAVAIFAVTCMTIIVVLSVVYSNK